MKFKGVPQHKRGHLQPPYALDLKLNLFYTN